MTPNEIIGFAWIAHALIFFLAAAVQLRAARRTRIPRHHGRARIHGRYVLTMFFLSYAVMSADVVRIRLVESANASSWWVTAIRWLPVPFELWIVWLLMTGGITRDRDDWDGEVERRQGLRREQDRIAYEALEKQKGSE